MNIILFLVLAAFILIVLAISNDRLNWRSKLTILAICILCFIAIFLYNADDKKSSQNINSLLYEFNSQKSLKCGEFKVNKESFNYEFGTQSFVSKDKSGVIIPIKNCIKDE